MTHLISRRSLLKGLTLGAGTSLLGPVLQQLMAYADGAPQAVRRRFVFVVQSNGINPNHIIPSGLPTRKDQEVFTNSETVEAALAGRELPEAVSELGRFRAG